MKKIVNRLIQCILTLFIVSVLCFALTKAAPGDPVLTYVEPNMSEEYIQNLREKAWDLQSLSMSSTFCGWEGSFTEISEIP